MKNKVVSFSKSGSGSLTPRVIVPITWLREMGVTPDDKRINMEYDKESKQIIIKAYEKK